MKNCLYPSKTQKLIRRIGKRIILIREERGVSQVELAKLTGLHPQQLFQYEMGEVRIEVDVLIEIALVLQMRLTDFLPVDEI